MQALADLDLPDLPMEKPEFAANPLPYFAAAREKHPWLAKSAFGYVVHQQSAMKDLLWMDGPMRTSFDGIIELMGVENTPWGRFTAEQMLAHTGATHRRIRDMLAPKFTPRQANLHRPLMREVISELLDEWVPKGSFDFEEFASYFPITVMARLIGAPPASIPGIRTSLEALGLGFGLDRNHVPALQKAIGVLDDFVQELVAERRQDTSARGEPDMLDLMLETAGEGGLTDRELYDLLIFLFVAGYDTSKNVLTYMMLLMIDNPHVYRRCAEDIAYSRKAVEEALRVFSPATIFRMTTENVTYRDVLLPKDTMLFFPVSVSGRDPTAVEDPDRFDPDRDLPGESRHIGFGRGVHLCLGQYIARAQLEEGLHLIAQRIRNPRRAGPMGWRPFPGVWGIKGLPIEFDPAPASPEKVRAAA